MHMRASLTVFVIVMMAAVPPVCAQATRTWVSGIGDDANPCARLAPCKTFAGAISRTAPGGEIDVLAPGGFGTVTITKSITIDGNTMFGAILASGTTGVVINGAGIEVTLRNLSINGAGTPPGVIGVRIIAASKVFIEQSVIFGFQMGTGRGVSDERTTGGTLFMTDTIVRNNSQSGVVIIQPAPGAAPVRASFHNCRFEGNGNGGLVISESGIATVKDSISTGNVQAGFFAEGSGTNVQMNVQSSVAAGNGQGITVLSGAIVRISQSHIVNNTVGLNPSGGGLVQSYLTNHIEGNGSGNGPANGPNLILK